MKDKEFIKLKNGIAIKSVVRIIIYSLFVILIFAILIDGIYNDKLANHLSQMDRATYLWCVRNKTLLMGMFFLVIFTIVSFIIIRNSNHHFAEMIMAMDQILKEPEKEVKLSNDLVILESRLNNIRVDLVANQHRTKEAENKKNDLIMYMAHDLKTPLTSVIGYLTLLTEEQEISKELQAKYTKIALDKSLRLEELTNQFFEITRYNLQNVPINKTRIDVSFLIDQLVDECYPMMQPRGLECIVEKPEHIYYMGDGDKLARAFGNLLKNAIYYSYKNTQIKIEAKQSEEKIKLIIKNKGDKIPEYKLEKLFEKFYRADESRTSATGGTGLGLAITKEMIELHGGDISVKNEDEWIEFCVEL